MNTVNPDKLLIWQKKNDLSDVEIAKELGVHPSSLSHYRAGRRCPSPPIALKIEQLSGGVVPFDGWYRSVQMKKLNVKAFPET